VSERIPVMHVIEAMHTGGAESVVVEYARHASPDFRVLVCALNRGGPALEAARAAGAGVWVLAKQGRRLGAVARLARVMREQGVRVAHGHNPTGALYAAAAAWFAHVPTRVRTEHSVRYAGRHSAAYPLLERALNRSDQRVLCVCEAVRQSQLRGGAPVEKLRVVENGVSEVPPPRPRPEVRAALGEPPEAPVVLAVGSLTVQKAHGVLIEGFARAARRRPDARLWIAGEGPLGDELEARARAATVGEAVRFLRRREDVADLLAAADVFVLPSRREGLSITLLEAMRAGCTPLVTDVGGSAEVVRHGESGWVVPPDDPEALGEALAALLGDAGLRRRLGEAARARWAERFTAQRMVVETERVYRELLAARVARGIDAAEVGRGRVVA
jgi:glycosyltransferase involved in cell wall biosynthesis